VIGKIGIETTCKKRQRDMEKELNEDDLDKENEPPCAPGKVKTYINIECFKFILGI